MKNRGFSLAELLVVIGIMVLVALIAVPAFSFITGSRSIENAHNIVAANVARARLDAIKHQEHRGVVFYRDANTDRVVMAMVRTVDRAGFLPDGTPLPDDIEIVPGTDVVPLPSGVEIAFRHTVGSGYLYRVEPEDLRGVILFDSKGHFASKPYGLGDGSEVARRLGITAYTWGFDGQLFYSQPAFLLADRSATNDAANQVQYLDQNASVVLINRYNGALTRSE